MSAARLTTDQKAEIVRRYRSGEAPAQIAAAFAVHPTYPGLLAKRRGFSSQKSLRVRGSRT